MKSSPAIERYNRLLLRDLGDHPKYEWKWSEDLIRVMSAFDCDGKPEMETVKVGNLYAVRQGTRTRKLAPDLVNQWVICALIELGKEDGQVHGTGLAAWMPVRDRRSRPVCLPENLMPNQEYTESFVQQVRLFRAKSAAKMDAEFIENEARKEKQRVDNYADAIKDNFTAFGEEPGKSGSTWFRNSKTEGSLIQ